LKTEQEGSKSTVANAQGGTETVVSAFFAACVFLFCSLVVARALIHPSSACDLHHTEVKSAFKNGHIKTKGTLLVHKSRLKESEKQQSNTFSSRALLRRRQCLLIQNAMFYSSECGVLASPVAHHRPCFPSIKFFFSFSLFSRRTAENPTLRRALGHSH
jgi:hypothetical protein